MPIVIGGARCSTIIGGIQPYVPEQVQPTSLNSKREIIMRRIVLALLAVASIAGSTTDIAYAKGQHRVHHARQYNAERFLNSNAGEAPAASQADAGMGGWASMTGFN
jgi:hypothetical protein